MHIEAIMRTAPVIPVLTIDAIERAAPLARALVSGGLNVLEITLRTPQALMAIAAIRKEVPDAIVGSGTVLNAADLRASRDAGAQFAVSPGSTRELLAAANDEAMPLLPGIATASEIMLGLEHGYRAFKFFPAENAGGVAALKALCAPFSQVLFCPTGGIDLQRAKDYLALPAVACVGGSWVAPHDALERGEWSRIEALAREASTALRRR